MGWNKVIVSGSRAQLLDVTASFFKGDGSQLTGIVSSISENASFPYTFTSQSFFEVTHSLNTLNPIVQTYDSNDEQNLPEKIKIVNADVISITYPTSQSGRVIVAKGGHIISGSLMFATSASLATTASYALTASYVQNSISSSYSNYALTSSYSNNSTTASYSLSSNSASYAPSLLEVKKDNLSIKTQTTEFNFTGSGVQVTDNGTGKVLVQITGSVGITTGLTEALSMTFSHAITTLTSSTVIPDGASIHRIQIKKGVAFNGTSPIINIYSSGSTLLPLITGSMSNLKSLTDDLLFDIYNITSTTSGSILLSVTGSGATLGFGRMYMFYTREFNS